jgi:hypothetical protein
MRSSMRLPSIESLKFDGDATRYPLWRMRLDAALATAGYVVPVQNEQKGEQNPEAKALAWFLLVNSVPESFLGQLMQCDNDPDEALKVLDRKYSGVSTQALHNY